MKILSNALKEERSLQSREEAEEEVVSLGLRGRALALAESEVPAWSA